MQKKLIALALASLAGSAFAQTNVTIYGVVDATFDNVRVSSSATFNDSTLLVPGLADYAIGNNYRNRNRVTTNSSFLGFRGVEDLGNGLKAVFQIEGNLRTDNGGGWGGTDRDTFVGLAGGFGTFVMGNITGPTRAMGSKLDVNAGATSIGANTALLGKLGGGGGSSAFDTRIPNAVAYISPNFSGFSGVIGYSAGIDAGTPGTSLAGLNFIGGENPTRGGNTAWTLGLNYENGPFYVGYAYTAVHSSNDLGIAVGVPQPVLNALSAPPVLNAGGGVYLRVPTQSLFVKRADDHRLGFQYRADWGQLGFLYERTGAKVEVLNVTLRQNVFYLSGRFNVTPKDALLAQFGWANNVKNLLNDTGARHFELGYEHSLSKRTLVKALYSHISNKDNAAYDFGIAPVGGQNGAGWGSKVSGFSVGLRHAF